MVCKVGDGKLSALVRVLTAGNCPNTTEDANYEQLAIQAIQREFLNADEANLLEEEDMHVFESRPLSDPLHLVHCTTCRKPVKVSQYAAHAGRCVLLNSSEHTPLGFKGGNEHKKPLKKGRKKSQATSGTSIAFGEQKTPENMEDIAGKVLSSGDQNGKLSSRPGRVKVAPIPLATKIYHSNGNHRLRLALGHLYYEACPKENGSDSVSSDATKGMTLLPSKVSSPPRLLSGAHKDGNPQKIENYSLPAAYNPDQIVAKSSESCLRASGVSQSAISISNHSQGKNIIRREPCAEVQVGMVTNSYRSKPYLYSGNPGSTLGTTRKTNGSVPVL